MCSAHCFNWMLCFWKYAVVGFLEGLTLPFEIQDCVLAGASSFWSSFVCGVRGQSETQDCHGRTTLVKISWRRACWLWIKFSPSQPFSMLPWIGWFTSSTSSWCLHCVEQQPPRQCVPEHPVRSSSAGRELQVSTVRWSLYTGVQAQCGCGSYDQNCHGHRMKCVWSLTCELSHLHQKLQYCPVFPGHQRAQLWLSSVNQLGYFVEERRVHALLFSLSPFL